MMAQYIEIKAANPDCLLFYRMGDFYEMFFDDAEVASRALGITLTKRGKHQGADIPMCGVPIHAADQYLQKLIALGHRVAVCEQIEDPAEARKRGGKSVVRRDVVRLVTPGTLTEDALLVAGRNNFLAAVARQRGGGDGADAFGHRLDRHFDRRVPRRGERPRPPRRRPRPHRAARGDRRRRALRRRRPGGRSGGRSASAVTPLAAAFFDGATAAQRLAGVFRRRQPRRLRRASPASSSRPPRRRSPMSRRRRSRSARRCRRRSGEAAGDAMLIDAATRANLELTATLSGERARQPDRRHRPHGHRRRRAAPGAPPGRALDRSRRRSTAASTRSPGCSPIPRGAERIRDDARRGARSRRARCRA